MRYFLSFFKFMWTKHILHPHQITILRVFSLLCHFSTRTLGTAGSFWNTGVSPKLYRRRVSWVILIKVSCSKHREAVQTDVYVRSSFYGLPPYVVHYDAVWNEVKAIMQSNVVHEHLFSMCIWLTVRGIGKMGWKKIRHLCPIQSRYDGYSTYQ